MHGLLPLTLGELPERQVTRHWLVLRSRAGTFDALIAGRDCTTVITQNFTSYGNIYFESSAISYLPNMGA